MKDTFYFSHDYNTRSDEKIVKLLRKHGMTGYGIFWGIVEMLYNNENSLKMDCDDIAYELRADAKMIESVINDFDLFTVNDGYFGSESIEKRLTERDKISERARQKAFKRWRKDTTASETDATASETDATAPKMDAGKERKGKDINERKEKIFFSEKVNSLFYEFIKNQRKPIDELRIDLLAENLEKLASYDDDLKIEIIKQAISGGHSDFRPLPKKRPPSDLDVAVLLHDQLKKMTPPAEQEIINYFLENKYSQDGAEECYKSFTRWKWKSKTGRSFIPEWKDRAKELFFKPEYKILIMP